MASLGKVILAHAVVFLEMADDGFDGGPPFAERKTLNW
jgi:hypothetical protein